MKKDNFIYYIFNKSVKTPALASSVATCEPKPTACCGMPIRDAGGFTLLEALIGLAVASIGLLAIMSQFTFSEKARNTVAGEVGYDSIANSINLLLATPGACTASFLSSSNFAIQFQPFPSPWPSPLPSALPVSVDHISMGGNTLVKIGQNLGGGLNVSELSLQALGVPPVKYTKNGINYTQYTAQLQFSSARNNSGSSSATSFGGPIGPSRVFNLTVSTDASNTVQFCGLISAAGSGVGNFIYAIHSQSDLIPSCPSNWTQLWTGYSYVGTFINGDSGALATGITDVTDLGSPGSCIQAFRYAVEANVAPSITSLTGSEGHSHYLSSSNFSSGILVSNKTGAPPVTGISRCVVCGTTSPVIAVHSQTGRPPSCPSGMQTVQFSVGSKSVPWNGFSKSGQRTSLDSPGSCFLKNYSTNDGASCTPVVSSPCFGGFGGSCITSYQCKAEKSSYYYFFLTQGDPSLGVPPDISALTPGACTVCQ